jgi:hypothetical protein
MNRFQQGSLFKLERKKVPDVWVFRWYETTLGKRIYKKQIIGRVTKMRNRREAEKTSPLFVVLSMPRSERRKLYAISRPVIDCMNSPGSERRFQPLRTIAFYSSVTSSRVGEIVGSLRFVPWRLRNGCTLFHWHQPRRRS